MIYNIVLFLCRVKEKVALSMMFSSDEACLESTHDLNEPFTDTQCLSSGNRSLLNRLTLNICHSGKYSRQFKCFWLITDSCGWFSVKPL